MHNLVKVMKSLSDETRLRILNLPLERACCVRGLMQVLGIPQSTASPDPGALYDAGFPKRRREGTCASFSINTESMAEYYLQIIKAVKGATDGNEMYKSDSERSKQADALGSIAPRNSLVRIEFDRRNQM